MLKREAPIAARDRLLLEIDGDRRIRIGGDRGAELGHVGFRQTIAVNSPFLTALLAKISPKDGATTQRMP